MEEELPLAAFERAIEVLESEQKYLQAFDYAEQRIETIRKARGTKGETLREEVRNQVQKTNKQAGDLLSQGKPKAALQLLRKTERLLQLIAGNKALHASLQCLTYNSMACVYKETRRLQLALNCLEKAIELGKLFGADSNLGVSYLNSSSILSLIGNHAQARIYAESAVKQLEAEIASVKLSDSLKVVKEKEALLGFGYFNMGLQTEYLGDTKGAQSHYLRAKALTDDNPEASAELKNRIADALHTAEVMPKPRSALEYMRGRYNAHSFHEKGLGLTGAGSNIGRYRPRSAKQEELRHPGVQKKSAFKPLAKIDPRPTSAKTDSSDVLNMQTAGARRTKVLISSNLAGSFSTAAAVGMKRPHLQSLGQEQKHEAWNSRKSGGGDSAKVPGPSAPRDMKRFSVTQTCSPVASLMRDRQALDRAARFAGVAKIKKELAREPRERFKSAQLGIVETTNKLANVYNEEIETDSDDELKDLVSMGVLEWSEEEGADSAPVFEYNKIRFCENGETKPRRSDPVPAQEQEQPRRSHKNMVVLKPKSSGKKLAKKKTSPVQFVIPRWSSPDQKPQTEASEKGSSTAREEESLLAKTVNKREAMSLVGVFDLQIHRAEPNPMAKPKKRAEKKDEEAKSEEKREEEEPKTSLPPQPQELELENHKEEEKVRLEEEGQAQVQVHHREEERTHQAVEDRNPAVGGSKDEKDTIDVVCNPAPSLLFSEPSPPATEPDRATPKLASKPVPVPPQQKRLVRSKSIAAIVRIQSVFRRYMAVKHFAILLHCKDKKKHPLMRMLYRPEKNPLAGRGMAILVFSLGKENGGAGGEKRRLEMALASIPRKNVMNRQTLDVNEEVTQERVAEAWREALTLSSGNFEADCKMVVQLISSGHEEKVPLVEVAASPQPSHRRHTEESVILPRDGAGYSLPPSEMDNIDSPALDNEADVSGMAASNPLLEPPVVAETKLEPAPKREADAPTKSDSPTVSKENAEEKPKVPQNNPVNERKMQDAIMAKRLCDSVVRLQRWYKKVVQRERFNLQRKRGTIRIYRCCKSLRIGPPMEQKADQDVKYSYVVMIFSRDIRRSGEVIVKVADFASKMYIMVSKTGTSYVLFNKASPVKEWVAVNDEELERAFPTSHGKDEEISKGARDSEKSSFAREALGNKSEEEKPQPQATVAAAPNGGDSSPKFSPKEPELAPKAEHVKAPVTVSDWKEKAVYLIQSYFRNFRKKVVLKAQARRGTIVSALDPNLSRPLITRGKIIDGRLTINKIFFCQLTNQLRILVCDCEGRRAQTFILDNFQYGMMTREEFEDKMNNVFENMEYNKEQRQFFVNLGEAPKDSDRIIGVIPLARDKSRAEDAAKASPKENNSAIEDPEGGVEQEIYRGLKKLGSFYYNIKVTISSEGKCRIFAVQDGTRKRTELDVDMDLKNYFTIDKSAEGELKLGRMIYNGVTAGEGDEVRFEDDQLKLAVTAHSFMERSKHLIKVQSRFRLCIAREKISLLRVRKCKRSKLRTEFGLKIGKQYHLMKILTNADRNGVIIVKSDKATNELELPLSELGMTEEDLESCMLKITLKGIVTSLLAFNPKKRMLVRHLRHAA